MSASPSTVLFLGNVDFAATEEDVRALCSSLDLAPSRINIPLDRYNGHPRGIAFLDWPNQLAAADALTLLSGAELLGRELRVDFAANPRPPLRDRRTPRATR